MPRFTISANPVKEGTTVPATVTIAAGTKSANFTVGTSGVDATITKWITATYDGLQIAAPLEIKPVSALTISMSPASVEGGTSSTGTITLNGKAGPSGLVVNLSSNKAYASVPATATVAAGATSITFTATTTDPGVTGTATITGTQGAVTGTGNLEVTAAGTMVQFLESSIKGGNALTLKVTLQAPAPTGGTVFTLSGDALNTPPATVKVAAGATTAEIGVSTNATLTTTATTITVTPSGGGTAKTASAVVVRPAIKSLNSAITVVAGAKTVKLLVLLDAIAPAGLSYAVSSNNGAITVPSSITVPAGANYVIIDMVVKKQPGQKTVKIIVDGKFINIVIKPNP